MKKFDCDVKENKMLEYWESNWAKVKDEYTKMFDKHIKVKSQFLKGKVLDLGCGIGLAGKYIINYTGVDFSEEGLKIAKQTYPHGNYYQADFRKEFKLPFKDDEFDTVLLSEVVEHLVDPKYLLNEAKRVGKKFIISVPQHLYCVDHVYPIWTISNIEEVFGMLGEIVHIAKMEGNFWLIIVEKDKNKFYYKVNE